jgi:hypothetical protein
MTLSTGKSTAVNFLLGRKMEMTRTPEGHRVVAVTPNEVEVSGIGHSMSRSKTLLPQIVKFSNVIGTQESSPFPNYLFADFPGFNESRGFEFNVANITNLKGFLRSCLSGVRILLLIDRRSIASERGRSVKDTVSLIKSMFSGSIDKIAPGVCVCLTKVTFGNFENERRVIEDQGDFEADLSFFSSQFSKELFELPVSQIQMLDPFSDWRCFLTNSIHKIPPILSPSSYFSPSLSDSDKYHVKILLDHIQSDIHRLLAAHRPSQTLPLCELVQRLTDLGFDVIDDSYRRLQQCVEEGLDRMCKSSLLLVDAHNPIELLRNSVVEKVREIHLSERLQNCFPSSKIASMITDFMICVRDRESNQQQCVDAKISTELSGLLQDLKAYLSFLNGSDPVVQRVCSITEPLLLQLSECSISLRAKAFPLHDLHSNMQIELKNRSKLYCNPIVEPLQSLMNHLNVESGKIILACTGRLSRELKFKSLEKVACSHICLRQFRLR